MPALLPSTVNSGSPSPLPTMENTSRFTMVVATPAAASASPSPTTMPTRSLPVQHLRKMVFETR
ncbi:hypothetical protein C2S52_007286 [Perilla frutescens var. hirtella]|nr:hypothetical protein C2S52_007286 [Perilla frutescens var. hirtella]